MRLPRTPLLLALLLLSLSAGCKESPTEPNGDSGAGDESHNAGRACLGCHDFTMAGTVYAENGTTPLVGAVVRLTTGAGGTGTVVSTMATDETGNFYTTRSIAFGSGLFADVAATAAATPRSMASAVTAGNCNSCHGASNRIRAF